MQSDFKMSSMGCSISNSLKKKKKKFLYQPLVAQIFWKSVSWVCLAGYLLTNTRTWELSNPLLDQSGKWAWILELLMWGKIFSSSLVEWVERNGPWNFDNNLLLLCRWRKGLSIANISFTHSPLWIQVWGLLFESMTEKVGEDLGSKLGKYINSDRRSWLSEQAKFMLIRVDIPIDKPLRRGGNIVNSDEIGRAHVWTPVTP